MAAQELENLLFSNETPYVQLTRAGVSGCYAEDGRDLQPSGTGWVQSRTWPLQRIKKTVGIGGKRGLEKKAMGLEEE